MIFPIQQRQSRAAVVRTMWPIDVIVHSAGYGATRKWKAGRSFCTAKLAAWEKSLAVNLTAALCSSKKRARFNRIRHGSVIFISSIYGARRLIGVCMKVRRWQIRLPTARRRVGCCN